MRLEILKKHYNLISFLLLLAGLILTIILGCNKQGYYIDEWYTITPANGTLMGVAVEPGEWNDTQDMLNQVSVQEGERFTYKRTIGNLYGNVHPPLYYMMVHTVSSLFVDTYSKWFGLSVNILLYLMTAYFVRELAYILSKDDRIVALIALGLYIFSPAILSGVMLTRDYISAALFMTALAYFLSKSFRDEKLTFIWFYFPVFFTVTAGALSEFLFLPACAVMVGLYGLYLLFIKKSIKDTLLLALTGCFSIAAILEGFHPYFKRILNSRRGHQVLEALGLRKAKTKTSSSSVVNNVATVGGDKSQKTASTFNKAKLYISNLNKNVFGGLLIVAIIIAIVALVILIKRWKKYSNIETNRKLSAQICGGIIIAITCIIYFVFIAKAGVSAKEASNRFVYLIYPLVLTLFVVIAVSVVKNFVPKHAYLITGALVLIMIISGYAQGQILYLYPGEANLKAWRAEHKEVPMVVVENDGQYDERIGDYLEYEKVFFARYDDLSTLEDKDVMAAKELLVYVDMKYDENGESISKVLNINPNISTVDLLYEGAGRFNVYYLH